MPAKFESDTGQLNLIITFLYKSHNINLLKWSKYGDKFVERLITVILLREQVDSGIHARLHVVNGGKDWLKSKCGGEPGAKYFG